MKTKSKSKKFTNVKYFESYFNRIWYLLPIISLLTLALGSLGFGDNLAHRSFNTRDFFSDFGNSVYFAQYMYGPVILASEGFSYFLSPVLVVFFKLVPIIITSYNTYEIFRLLMCFIVFFVLTKYSKNLIFTLITFFSAPMIYLLGRGNPDLFILLVMLVSLNSIQSRKKYRLIISIIVASAIKFPEMILLICLFPLRNRIKYISFAIASTLILYIAPLLANPYSVSSQIKNFFVLLGKYTRDYSIGDGGTVYNSSLFGLFKCLIYLVQGNNLELSESLAVGRFLHKFYYPSLLILLLILLIFLIKRYKDILLKMGMFEYFYISIILLILLPEVSNMYRLSLLIPILYYLNTNKLSVLHESKYVFAYIVLMAPKNVITFSFENEPSYFTLDSIVNPIVLTYILIYTCNQILKNKGTLKFLAMQKPTTKI